MQAIAIECEAEVIQMFKDAAESREGVGWIPV
jgi:hypothetical protein